MENSPTNHHLRPNQDEESLQMVDPLEETTEKNVKPELVTIRIGNALIHVLDSSNFTNEEYLQQANLKVLPLDNSVQLPSSSFQGHSPVGSLITEAAQNLLQVEGVNLLETLLSMPAEITDTLDVGVEQIEDSDSTDSASSQNPSEQQIDNEESPQETQKEESKAQCTLCSCSYNCNGNLYSHMRTKHQLQVNTGGTNKCPLLCGEKFRAQKDLRAHLVEKHDQALEQETYILENITAFAEWKEQLQATTGQNWIRHFSVKQLKNGRKKSYYMCQRSGTHKPAKSTCRRARPATVKIGTTCPSVMEVSQNTDSSVHVVLWKTHIGHGTGNPRPPQRRIRKRNTKKIPYEVCVILPAAGVGQRMGGNTPKPFIPIHKKPIVCYTADIFLRLPFIKKVAVVAASDSLELMVEKLEKWCQLEGDKLVVAEGAGTRHGSIYAGLKALQTSCETPPELVVIHDAVRAFVTEESIRKVIHAAKVYGAAGLTCPLVSTVVSPDMLGFLETSLDRKRYVASEMPQAFKFDLILKAYDMCSELDMNLGTDCMHLVHKYVSVKAKLLPGTTNLWKVTHHKDIHTVAAAIKESQSAAIVCSDNWSSLASLLKKTIEKTFKPVLFYAKFQKGIITTHPNIVEIKEEPDPYLGLERLARLATKQIGVFRQTIIVHVFINAFEPPIDHLEFQKQAKNCAKRLKEASILVYFVIFTGESETIEELGELLRSLMFDSNPSTSGSVHLY